MQKGLYGKLKENGEPLKEAGLEKKKESGKMKDKRPSTESTSDKETQTVKAWLVKDCPNFFMAPSMCYDRVFLTYEEVGKRMSPEYWKARGFEVIPLVQCEDSEAQYWILSNQQVAYFREYAETAKELGHTITPVCPQK